MLPTIGQVVVGLCLLPRQQRVVLESAIVHRNILRNRPEVVATPTPALAAQRVAGRRACHLAATRCCRFSLLCRQPRAVSSYLTTSRPRLPPRPGCRHRVHARHCGQRADDEDRWPGRGLFSIRSAVGSATAGRNNLSRTSRGRVAPPCPCFPQEIGVVKPRPHIIG
jgi:hypothetical protein